jgi:hypothetical protein
MKTKPRISILFATLALAWVVAPAAARADVVLNEVNCEGTDWVELVNTSADPADVSGWLLTDDPIDRDPPRVDHRLTFAAGAEIDAHAALVVERGDGGFPFGISCAADTVRLADPAGAPMDEVAIPALELPGSTWGRYPSGTGAWTETISSPGAANEPAADDGPPPDLAGWMFDPAMVVDVGMTLPPESIEALNQEPEEYVPGTFSLTTTGASYGPLQVGIRLKGGRGSMRPLTGKSAFKVKFSHSVSGQRFLGLKTLTLNNMVQDPSMISETLSYRVFRAAGIAAPRTGYASVSVNGAEYGLYLNVETPDLVMLRNWYASTQHLYEGEYGADAVPGGGEAFQVDEGDENDRGDLEALIADASGPSEGFAAAVAPRLDLAQATRMWAVEKYVGHWDGYAGGVTDPDHPNNYFLHSDASGRFTFMPWGTDLTWEGRIPFDEHGGALFRFCQWSDECRAMYREAVAEISALVQTLDMDAMAVSLSGALRPWQELDPRREYSLQQIDAAVATVRQFIAQRPADAARFLEGPTPRVEPVPALRVRITAAPASRSRNRRVRFRFEANREGTSFECRLDRDRYAPCSSPVKLSVAPGPYRFRVKATSPAGEVARDNAKFVVTGRQATAARSRGRAGR